MLLMRSQSSGLTSNLKSTWLKSPRQSRCHTSPLHDTILVSHCIHGTEIRLHELVWYDNVRRCPEHGRTQAEDVCSLTILTLKHVRSEAELVSFTLETNRLLARDQLRFARWRRPRPYGRHPEVTDLQPSLPRQEDIGRLQVKVDNVRVVNESQTGRQLGHDLPDARLVQPWECAAVFPEEVRKVTELAELRLDVESLVLLPTINVAKDIGMTADKANGRIWRPRCGIRKVFQNVDLFAKAETVKANQVSYRTRDWNK